jgi:hypothetical protein
VAFGKSIIINGRECRVRLERDHHELGAKLETTNADLAKGWRMQIKTKVSDNQNAASDGP